MARVRSAAVVLRDDQLLLLHRIKRGEEYWMFPGGRVEENEQPEDAALRELREETSIEGAIEMLLYHFTAPSDKSPEQFFYLVRYESGEPKLSENAIEHERMAAEDNFYEPLWMPVAAIAECEIRPLPIRDQLLADLEVGFIRGAQEIAEPLPLGIIDR